ncbi:hypothetical protein WN944_006636 [Citrus x changshan-huyou]|uniref:TFIIS central domain-containing protein n=1 Tax=Citrus x changshan-huyou TaxID=2935761 RepID=A0AAP0MPN8_9ROSI
MTLWTGNSGSLLIKTMKIISSMRLISLDQKTRVRFGDLPDIEPQETAAQEQEDRLKAKRMLWKKNISPLDVSREEGCMTREASPRPSTCAILLTAFMQFRMGKVVVMGLTMKARISQRELKMDIEKRNGNSFLWPDTAIAAVTALEKASHDALSSDFQKHNQKLRQLLFNLKSTALLALRFLKGKLEPSKILDMSPNELNEGLTAEETAKEESDESEQMQMLGAQGAMSVKWASGTSSKQDSEIDISIRIKQVGVYCRGHSWYASRNEASSLTIDGRGSTAKSVGIASLAAAKFDSLEKNLSESS